jgi:hypothetical protein
MDFQHIAFQPIQHQKTLGHQNLSKSQHILRDTGNLSSCLTQDCTHTQQKTLEPQNKTHVIFAPREPNSAYIQETQIELKTLSVNARVIPVHIVTTNNDDLSPCPCPFTLRPNVDSLASSLSSSASPSPQNRANTNPKSSNFAPYLVSVSSSLVSKHLSHLQPAHRRNVFDKPSSIPLMDVLVYYDMMATNFYQTNMTMKYIKLLTEAGPSGQLSIKIPSENRLYSNTPTLEKMLSLFDVRHQNLSFRTGAFYRSEPNEDGCHVFSKAFAYTNDATIRRIMLATITHHKEKSETISKVLSNWNTQAGKHYSRHQEYAACLNVMFRRLQQLPSDLCDLNLLTRCFAILDRQRTNVYHFQFQAAIRIALGSNAWAMALNAGDEHADLCRRYAPVAFCKTIDKIATRTQLTLQYLLERINLQHNNSASSIAKDDTRRAGRSKLPFIPSRAFDMQSQKLIFPTDHSAAQSTHPTATRTEHFISVSQEYECLLRSHAITPSNFRTMMFELTLVTLLSNHMEDGASSSVSTIKYTTRIPFSNSYAQQQHSPFMAPPGQTAVKHVVLCTKDDFEKRAQFCRWMTHRPSCRVIQRPTKVSTLPTTNDNTKQHSRMENNTHFLHDAYFLPRHVFPSELLSAVEFNPPLLSYLPPDSPRSSFIPQSEDDGATATTLIPELTSRPCIRCTHQFSQLDVYNMLTKEGYSVAMVTGFNPEQPGGGVLEGHVGSEEDLFIRTDILRLLRTTTSEEMQILPTTSPSLSPDVLKLWYNTDRETLATMCFNGVRPASSNAATPGEYVPVSTHQTKPIFQSLHVPNIWCFRDAEQSGFAFRSTPFQANVILYRANPFWYSRESMPHLFREAQIESIYAMIQNILENAVECQYNALVVDSFGCGTKYDQHPLLVARCWKIILEHHPKWKGQFKKVYFVIPYHLHTTDIGESIVYDELDEYFSQVDSSNAAAAHDLRSSSSRSTDTGNQSSSSSSNHEGGENIRSSHCLPNESADRSRTVIYSVYRAFKKILSSQ